MMEPLTQTGGHHEARSPHYSAAPNITEFLKTAAPRENESKKLAKGKKWSGTSDLRIRAVGALSECFFRLKDIYQPQGGESRPRFSARAHAVGSRVGCLGPRFGCAGHGG